jgi:uncharacterized protein
VTAFVDTSAVYAVLDADDQSHPRATAEWDRLLDEDAVLLTTNYILVETSALVQSRLGHAALRAFYEDIVPRLTIQWITEAAHAQSVEALLTAGRRKLSLVDCVSFHVMRQIGISTAFTFDRHFREQGFSVVPG